MIKPRGFSAKAVPKKLRSESPESFVPCAVFETLARIFDAYSTTAQAVGPAKIRLGALRAVFKRSQPASD